MSMHRNLPVLLHWRTLERLYTVHLGIIHIGLGVAFFVGGHSRVSSVTYRPLLDLSNGEIWPYSLALLFSGSLLVMPFIKVNYLGHWVGVIFFNLLAAMFGIAVVRYDSAGALLWWVTMAFATFHGVHIALTWVRRSHGLYDDWEPRKRRGES